MRQLTGITSLETFYGSNKWFHFFYIFLGLQTHLRRAPAERSSCLLTRAIPDTLTIFPLSYQYISRKK
jgi:hypothetical protein